MPTVKNLFISPEQTSKAIMEVAEKIEYLKVLYHNYTKTSDDSVNEVAMLDYETDIRLTKWAIIAYISNDANYLQWKNFNKNSATLFFKYFNKGHFEKEIGYNQDLRIKIISDFKSLFDSTPKEILYTNKEKQLLKYYQENNIITENQESYADEEKLVLNLHDKDSCFNASYSYLLENIPEQKKLPKEGQNAVVLIKKNPILLADNPYHFVLNRNKEKFPTLTCDQFYHTLLDSTVGDKQAIETLKKMVIILDKLDGQESQKEMIREIRSKALDSTNKNTVKFTK